MNIQEFSNQFDTLVSSYRRFKDFDNKESLDSIEFDEYEKSVYLTNAQEELILSLYNGKNVYGESFEETEELRRYLANLIQEKSITPMNDSEISSIVGMDDNKHSYFKLPGVWFITYESVKTAKDDSNSCNSERVIQVIPAKQDEYNRIKKNPFRGPNNRRALRFDLSNDVVEIVSKFNIASYYIRYLIKPTPIILVNLPNGLTINGSNEATPCAVHESLHQRILELAVRKALQDKVGAQPKTEQK